MEHRQSHKYKMMKNMPPDDEKYLATLKYYIDDKTFDERLLSLPKITSAVVKRLEKIVSNEQKLKLASTSSALNTESNNKIKNINLKTEIDTQNILKKGKKLFLKKRIP